MKSEKYIRHVEELSERTSITSSDILVYNDLPLENVFEQLFLFCIDNIERFSEIFGVTPIYFFYRNTFNINAGAVYHNKNYIIYITQGLIVKLNEKLGSKGNFFENSKLMDFKKLQNELSDNLNHLMFQCSMIFTFYHEFAHIVQQKDISFSLNEESKIEEYKFERHIYEYDADINGTSFVSIYIQQYYNEQIQENLKTKQNFDNLMYLGISSIIITFILFLNQSFESKKSNINDMRFYTKEKTHPHTFVRLNYIIKHYIHIAKSNFSTIEMQDTLSNVSRICHEYFKETTIFKNFATNFNSNIIEINKYNQELNVASQKMKNLIRHKVNLFQIE